MARSTLTAPAHIVQQRNALGNALQAPDSAPSLSYGGGIGLQDSRLQFNRTNNVAAGATSGTGIIGWYDTSMVLNAVPSTISAVNIAASQSPAAGAITLVSTSGAGVTVLATAFQAFPSLNVIPVGALALDGNPGYQKFGLRDRTWFYDQTAFLARNVRLTSGGNDSGITFTVSGYDVYGYPQTETITGANAGVAAGKKAFKWVTGVTHTGSVAGTLTIGTGDVYGFPLRADQFGYTWIVWNGTSVTASTGFVVADTTNPATATTGDVRGTYAVQSASDGTKRLEIGVSLNIVALNTTPITNGIFGVTPA
ncbi:MAG: hypothetical protein JWP25_4690 [Bradyrhizobium sp.]|nr:hypothetical protein [Bradyrhizobium sp.]